ncbi:MAG: oxidoreductase [Streptosporangiales bacterium]|nr:oxidoreductase [Streptosporangiales bacterium]
MSFDLTDTTASQINALLTRERHRLGSPAMGMVLTLVIVTDERAHYDAVRAATEAGREHPSRILTVISRGAKGPPRLDAEVRVSEPVPGETVLLRLYGPLGGHPESVAAPLLVPDTPVVIWWPGQAPAMPAEDPLGALAQRRVTDAASAGRPTTALVERARGYRPGDTDLSWTRLTPWRSLLAASLDGPHDEITGGSVAAAKHNPSAEMLTAWLGLRLGVPVERTVSRGPGITAVRIGLDKGEIAVTRPDGRVATLSLPGQPGRQVALHRRSTSELLAEELRRLDPDEVYAETVRRTADDLTAGAESVRSGS